MPQAKSLNITFSGTVHDATDLGMVLGAQGLLSQQNFVTKKISNDMAGLLVKTFDERRAMDFTRTYAAQKRLGNPTFTSDMRID